MFICTMKLDKKRVVFWLIMAALVIVGIILLVGASEQTRDAERHVQHAVTGVRSEKNRVAYLAQYGWEVTSPALSEKTVVIPRDFNTVFNNYNELQKRQGFDLSEYRGMEVKQYTYTVIGSDIGENVVAVLYVYAGSVIGGDVHSTALDGLMVPIKE